MLKDKFISLCKEYSKNSGDVIYECVEEDKKVCRYIIEFYRYIVEFRYVKKESVYFKASSLYCVIKLEKNSQVHYHLTDIIPYLPRKNFSQCYFGLIESEEKLEICFASLLQVLNSVFSQIEPFLSGEMHLRSRLFDEYKILYSLKEKDIDFYQIDNAADYAFEFFASLQKTRDGATFSRYYNFTPYVLLQKNQIKKAFAKYDKLNQKGKLFKYEKCLIEYIANREDDSIEIFSVETDIFAEQKFIAFSSLVKAFLLVTAIASVFFCGFFAIFDYILSRVSVVHLSAPWYIGILCASLCGVFGAIAFFPYLPNQYYTKKQMKEYMQLFYPEKLKKFAYGLFAVSVIAAIVFTVLIAKENILFCEESIKVNSCEYSYSDITDVYYINARYNEYGDRIERGSYVILFDDETSLDLDGYSTIEYTKEKILPLLADKGYTVKIADSERDLPWYN